MPVDELDATLQRAVRAVEIQKARVERRPDEAPVWVGKQLAVENHGMAILWHIKYFAEAFQYLPLRVEERKKIRFKHLLNYESIFADNGHPVRLERRGKAVDEHTVITKARYVSGLTVDDPDLLGASRCEGGNVLELARPLPLAVPVGHLQLSVQGVPLDTHEGAIPDKQPVVVNSEKYRIIEGYWHLEPDVFQGPVVERPLIDLLLDVFGLGIGWGRVVFRAARPEEQEGTKENGNAPGGHPASIEPA